MRILLQWLVEWAWVLYVGCVLACVVYVVRALTAQNERRMALFTLELEVATARAMQAWVMVLVFIGIGVLVFLGATYILPGLPGLGSGAATSTPALVAGLQIPTTGAEGPATRTPGPLLPTLTAGPAVPTAAPEPATEPAPTLPPEPTGAPEPTLTQGPVAASAPVNVGFGDFAMLVSFSVASTDVSSNQHLGLDLNWQALGAVSSEDYTVFTHLTSEDGRLIAQHDGMPAGGTRPTTGWVPGENVLDTHPMAFRDSDYVGPARISVGMYDSEGMRVKVGSGSDHVVLPTLINIVAP